MASSPLKKHAFVTDHSNKPFIPVFIATLLPQKQKQRSAFVM